MARLIDRGTRIDPFGDPVGEIPLLGRSLAAFRDEEIAASGVDGERFTFADFAIATAPVLAAFAAKGDGKPRKLALPKTSACAALVPVSSAEDLVFEIYLDAPDEDARARATPTIVELETKTRRRELPRVGPPPHHIDLPCDGKIAAHVEHWVHVLWLSSALVPALVARKEMKLERRFRRGFYGKSGFTFFGRDPGSNLIAKGAQIHPSAYLEGAVIGENAVIGACCSIRHSFVGARTNLADFTQLSYCAIGDDTSTLANARLSHVIALGGGTLTSFFVKDILLGKNVFMTSGVIFWSESIDGTIHVEHNGVLRDTKRKVLGGCAGHGSVLGARTIVAPGKALPNRVTVVMRKEEGVQRIDPKLDGAPSCWYDASLVPVTEAFPGYVPDEL